MASMRRLKRRLARWQRWAEKTQHNPRHRPAAQGVLYLPGHTRAIEAVDELVRQRRIDRGLDDERCCNTGREGHPGPCVWDCGMCKGTGDCIECGGLDDLGCDECGGSGACSYCNGDGEIVQADWGPSIVTEDAFSQLELL